MNSFSSIDGTAHSPTINQTSRDIYAFAIFAHHEQCKVPSSNDENHQTTGKLQITQCHLKQLLP